MYKFILLLLVLLHVGSLTSNAQTTYVRSINDWHEARIKRLKSETGYLNLAGLIWLQEGDNTIGSAGSNQLQFPAKAAARLGVLNLHEGKVTYQPATGITVSCNGKAFNGGVIYDEKDTAAPKVMAYESLRWFIIKRGARYAIRLRDLESDVVKEFTSIERFVVDSSWCITATIEIPLKPDSILVTDVIGLTTPTPVGGILHFTRNGKSYQLIASLEEEDDLFIVFADQTTGTSTYGGGRFLYAKKPKTGNQVVLDFNKAYNPPCCFTPFATCPLPVPQNRLALEITAGEKTYGNHH